MVDAPESNPNNDQPNKNLGNFGATPLTADTTKPKEEQEQTKQHRKYTQYVMRLLKAMGRGFIAVVNWIDAKGPFVTAIATVLIAGLTGAYVHYSRAQWKVMTDQLEQMKLATTAATTAATNASESLIFSGESFKNDQRAWLGLVQPKLQTDPKTFYADYDDSGNYRISLAIKNVGKTPAFDVRMIAGYKLLKPGETLRPEQIIFGAKPREGKYGAFYPQIENPPIQLATSLRPTDPEKKLFVKKQLITYAFECLTFYDAFSRFHWVHFCGVIANGETSSPCDIYNETDPYEDTSHQNKPQSDPCHGK